jgi:hypothetical protein
MDHKNFLRVRPNDGAPPTGSQLGGSLALHQTHDDLAPESGHTVARPNALVPNDLSLAFGEPLPSLHHPDTNWHEEFLPRVWWEHNVSAWNSLFA